MPIFRTDFRLSAPTCPRFSEHFSIGKSQHELEFVDILLEADLPVYIDPYALKIGTGLLPIVCNNLVVDFFAAVLDCIKNGKHSRGRELLGKLQEPNETRLGVSVSTPQGRGVGNLQAESVYDKLQNSPAATTGLLRDLSDCELLIRGISQDKISDITTNIIRGELAAFTTSQCRKFSVSTQKVTRGSAWSEANQFWTNGYAELPIYKGKPLLLVPKWMIRRHIAVNHQEYYNNFVLEYLQQEHLNSNSSMVEVLKSGRRRVTKKALKEAYLCSKDYLGKFSEQHPDILRKYRASLDTKQHTINSSDLEKMIKDIQEVNGGVSICIHSI